MKNINIVITALFLQANSARSGTGMEEPQPYICTDVLTSQQSYRLGEPPFKSNMHCICVTHTNKQTSQKTSVNEQYMAKEQMTEKGENM